jgi:uncharacterized protein (TIGR00730 family)
MEPRAMPEPNEAGRTSPPSAPEPPHSGGPGSDGSGGEPPREHGGRSTNLVPPRPLPPNGPTTPPDRREDFDRLFLQGPRSRWRELWRIARIAAEFVRGFRTLHFVGPCVTTFGSARAAEGHPDYERARELGAELVRAGFTVMTGGGPGLMEAANRGAKEAGGFSVGSNIKLVDFETPNEYLDVWVPFHYFFVRKVMLVRYSYAFVFLPGGFGTLDEVFETATLVQTRKIRDFPMIFMGTEFWRPLMAFLEQLAADGKINQEDLDRFIVTDSPEEAAQICRDAALRRFGLSYTRPARRRWWLLE